MDKVYIASIYKKLGMATDPEIVEKQLELATALLEDINCSQAKLLVLAVFGVKISPESILWLVEAAADINPGLATNGVDGDVVVLALAVLREIVKSDTQIAAQIAISVESTSFGGKRACELDPDFLAFAQTRLQNYQVARKHISPMTESSVSDIDDLLEDIGKNAPQDSFALAWDNVRSVFEELDATQRTVAEVHSSKLQELVGAIRELEEQQQTQWYAISKWSKGANLPYGKIPIGEAIVRAAVELAQITSSTAGTVAAPALLHMALSEAIISSGEKRLPFVDFCIASPIVWRKSWVKVDLALDSAKLTPILAALSMASQANDEADWQARFKREMGIDPHFEILPLEFSLQLFHELLVMKSGE